VNCGCCSRIVGREPAPAVYRWWTHGGRYWNDLCESCSGWWLIGLLEGGDPLPHGIELLSCSSDA
jgi:hypothetical protein